MNFEYGAGFAIAIALAAYLFFGLIRPEKF
jgi:K+-transporting ATPase KdpF subunit